MGNKTSLTNFVRRMTGALMKAGVKSVVISPGSRSTPLAYAFASTKSLNVYIQVDERSAGFFALGLAKATGEPVVLLCTSGTAASNYFPAVTEAHYARIPLIVITADRPHELREVGAPQAIDQIQLYGNHVKYSVDFPLAEENADVDDYIERHVQRAASVALSAPYGPIHLNVPFREPLLIDFEMDTPAATFIQRMKGIDLLDASTAQFVTEILNKTEKGLLVVGELPIGIDTEVFWKFAKALNWPVLCDPLSNLRTKVPANCMDLCIDRYDALLKSELFKEKAIPDTVIRLGAQPVSKPLSLFLKKARPETVVLIDESPQFRDPLGIVTHHIQSSVVAFLQINVQKEESSYAKTWGRANDEVSVVMENSLGSDEGAYTQMLFSNLPDGSDLFSGSSMPIRDVDTFFSKTEKNITIFANRGTNGIDGVVSTALGIQAARQRPTWLLIGDLSFLHDVNGLIVSRFHETDLTIVIMNNDGGGIFSYLPQAESGNHFERLFGTPTGLRFEHIAAMYDAQYSSIESIEEFEQELSQEKKKNIRIIEVFTNRKENVIAHRTLWNEITNRIDSIE
jgi:2-succinyl-5-enolpyruvyl-6-hydroxy-3-cyclohexene-1-carboxylate synthase